MKSGAMINLLLLSLLWLGCRRDKTPTIYVHKEMLPYCWFPNGGYWVYEDVTTPGVMDSTYSYGVPSISVIPDDYREGFASEKYRCGIFFQGRQAGHTIFAYGYGSELQFSFSVLKEAFTDSNGYHEDDVFFWDSTNPDSLGSSGNMLVALRLDSIVVSGMVYHDAIQFTTIPPQAANRTFETVWARGVGIVRRSMTDGTIWELVRYHINQ